MYIYIPFRRFNGVVNGFQLGIFFRVLRHHLRIVGDDNILG